MKHKTSSLVLALACALMLPVMLLRANPENKASNAPADKDTPVECEVSTCESEATRDESSSVQAEVDQGANEKADAKREEITKEAMAAVEQTREALRALEAEKPEDALAALEKVTGKLALMVARKPDLALAPVDVELVTYDLVATPNIVRNRIKSARTLLADGEVQAARRMLDGMASETRIRTNHIPLATYPEAIARIAPLIDEGKMDAAKSALQLALNTLVVTEEIVPLPPLRAQALLKSAEELAENADRDAEQDEALNRKLEAARFQVEMAEALGYGQRKQFKPILEDIAAVEKKVRGHEDGQGLFATLKEKLANL